MVLCGFMTAQLVFGIHKAVLVFKDSRVFKALKVCKEQ